MKNKIKLQTKTLLQAKVHRGHRIRERNPHMIPYIYGERYGHYLINVEYSAQMLYEASQVIKEVYQQKGRILSVRTRPRINFLTKSLMPKVDRLHIITRRWIPGTLTNWDSMREFLEDFEEKLRLERRYLGNFGIKKSQKKRFQRHFKVLQNIKEKPDLLILFHCNEHPVALNEAVICQVPTIGIVDTDRDPRKIDFPIPGNDDSLYAHYLYNRVLWQDIYILLVLQ